MYRYHNKILHVEDVPVHRIAETIGTPVYVYSKKQLLANYDAYRAAFRNIPTLICYALKANSNLALLKLLARKGSGADIVSGGELYIALKAGFPVRKIVFAGVGKTSAEIEWALRRKILALHVESEQELLLINEIAAKLGTKAPVSFRINPNIDARTHPYISTGLRKHKFGISIRHAISIYTLASKLNAIRIEGMHIHLGSQIGGVRPFEEAARKALKLIDDLNERGIHLRHLDIGGGLAVSKNKSKSSPSRLASVLKPLFKGRSLQLMLEPGRSIVANAGILLTRVLYTKENDRKHFMVVDAGMNDFIRPSLYDAIHPVIPATQNNRRSKTQDVVGPVCESGDFFARDRVLQPTNPGELIVIAETGAYGFSMSSNYNSRPRAAEVLVDGKNYSVIRRRESFQNLIHGSV